MSTAPQNPKQQAPKSDYSNQGKPAQAGNDIKKGEDRMKNEGGISPADKKPTQSGTK